MQHPLAARRQAQPTGVIETLSAGYAALNRQWWVLLLPILVDVFLWLGPHVSYSPLVDPAVTHATELARQVAVGPRRVPRDLQVSTGLDDARLWVITRADDVNGLSVLARGPLALPSLAAVPNARGDLAFITGWAEGLLLLLASGVGGLLLGGWFYRGLADGSTGVPDGPLAASRGLPRDVIRVLGLVAALLGVGLLLGLPVMLLLVFTFFVSQPIAAIGALLVAFGLAFGALHLFFAVDAIFVSRVGPLVAIQRSVGVVRRHLWPSVAFFLLSLLIWVGMTRVWDVLSTSLQFPYGTALSILGNAYIASGLIAAGMIFYTERVDAPRAVAATSAAA